MSFGPLDWAIVAAYLLLTTVVGARLAGKQATIRDFFLGGRRLPWWAICGSIVATEISAATFIGVPAISFAARGNLTYLQLGLGAILARLLIGVFFVPRYYAEEIYSPYDYMGLRLGPRVKTVTTLLFFVGGCLGQGARVFVTAFVLREVAGFDLRICIWIIGAFAIGWTLLGGITTVIWTDVIQFGILLVGAALTLAWSVGAVEGGVDEVVRMAREAGKFQWLDTRFDLQTDPPLNYTLWIGLLAMPFLNLAALGIDQVMAQRMFCCRTRQQASLAIIASSLGQIVALIMLLVGIALYAYYQHHPPTAAQAALLAEDGTRVLPMFIVGQIPIGVRGLIVAAIFAAAVSSLDSALAALAQTTVSGFRNAAAGAINRLTGSRRAIGDIALSKILVVFWGIVLCGVATLCIPVRDEYQNVIDLVLGLVAYTYGPLLGVFLLAFLPLRRDDAGLLWAVLLAMLSVFALTVRGRPISELGPFSTTVLNVPWSSCLVWLCVAILIGLAFVRFREDARRVGAIAVTLMAILFVERTGHPHGIDVHLSPFWGYPLGTLITLFVAWALGNPARRPLRVTEHPRA